MHPVRGMEMVNARTFFAVAAIGALSAAPALAQTAAPSASVAAPLTLTPATPSGTTLDSGASVGTFEIVGRGVVIVRGQLTVYGTLTGQLIVRDFAGTAIVKLSGVRMRPRVLANGVRLYNYPRLKHRSIYVKGRNVRVAFATGTKGSVAIAGFGFGSIVRMTGTGSYVLNDSPRRPWSGLRVIPIRPAAK